MKTYFKTREFQTELFIAGGGLSGVACALAAARQGTKVVLCQDRPVLGGNASSEIRMHVVGASGGRDEKDGYMEARETGLIEEIRGDNSFLNAQRSPSMFDFILYDKVQSEPNITLYLNTRVVGCEVTDGVITAVKALRSTTEEEFVFKADLFVDCTGDGGLGYTAGAEYAHGREDKAAFNEKLAVDVADSETMGCTLLFMARMHPHPMPFIAPSWARKFTEDDLKHRPHAGVGVDKGLEYGYWWIEWGGHLNTIADDETIRHELLSIVMGVWDHIKNSGDHSAECWALDWFGAVPGKRESRRFMGLHLLTESDVLQSRPFEDAIAFGGWPIDIHPTRGIDAPEEWPCVATKVPLLFDIPLRACISRNVKNLLFAGRNISATHVAFASTRVMATCTAMGEGVGVAAAYSIANKIAPGELACTREAMEAIQQALLREDVFLIGKRENPEGNLVSKGKLSASSEQPDGQAIEVLSGATRSVNGERGVAPERVLPGWHRWKSRPEAGFPASIEVVWETPVSASRVELTFDTGLSRFLTLSQSVDYVKLMVWGTGQPETVKDYRIEVKVDGEWITTESVQGNWKRRRRHSLPSKPLEGVRVVAESTWGLDHARLMRLAVV